MSKAGDTYTDIVYIGTLLHFDALLANVAKNPSYKTVKYRGVISFATNGELWDAWETIFTDLANEKRQDEARAFYEANREAMLEGTAVLWEEKLSYYDLMVIRISEGEASFNNEIQNDPIDPENCTFQEEWFDFWDDEGKQQPDFSDPRFLFIGANDPSLGKNKKSDTSSIFALAKDTSHLEMGGRVYPADSPVWDVWFPPNGFKCRCTVKTLSKRQVEQRGLKVETTFPAIAPDPHFGTNPAKVRFEPDLKGYPEPLVKAYRAWEKEGAPQKPTEGP